MDRLEQDKQLLNDYHTTFGTAHGHRVLLDLVKKFHLLSPTFDPRGGRFTTFKEGERNVVLAILTNLNMTERDLTVMAGEVVNEKRDIREHWRFGETPEYES